MLINILILGVALLFGCKTVERLDFDPSLVKSSGAPALIRNEKRLEKEYLLGTCLKDRVTHQAIAWENFRVDGVEGTPTLASNAEGCIYWKERVGYVIGEQETYRMLDRTLVGVGTVVGTVKLSLAVNPWRDSVIDTRFQEIPAIESVSPNAVIRAFEYRFTGRRFEIDAHLKLTQTREYHFTLTPRWADKEQSVEPRVGERFRLAVLFAALPNTVQAPLESRRLFSQFETEVSINEHHQISAQVPLRVDFPEEPYLDSGMEVFLELRPLEAKGKGICASQVFDARRPSGGGSLHPESFSVAELHDKLVPREMSVETHTFGRGRVFKPVLRWEKSPYDMLVSSLPQLDVHDVKELPEPKKPEVVGSAATEDRTTFIGTNKQAIQCHRASISSDFPLLQKQSLKEQAKLYLESLPAPWPGYTAQTFAVVESVAGPLPSAQIVDDQLQFTASFFHESSEFERELKAHHDVVSWEGGVMGFTTHAVEWEAGLKAFGNGVNYKGNAGIDARYGRWTRDQSIEIKERDGLMVDRRNRVTTAETRMLYAEERSFDLPLVLRRCLLLTPTTTAKRPQLYCVREKRTLRENWYYLADFDFRHDIPVERRNMKERTLVKMIRGRHGYLQLKERLRNQTMEFTVREKSALEIGVNSLLEDALLRRDSIEGYFVDGGIFPGIIELSASGSRRPLLPDSGSSGR